MDSSNDRGSDDATVSTSNDVVITATTGRSVSSKPKSVIDSLHYSFFRDAARPSARTPSAGVRDALCTLKLVKHPKWKLPSGKAFGDNAWQLLVWIFFSIVLTMWNKHILSHTTFTFPVALAILHMSISSALAMLMLRCKMVETADISLSIYLRFVAPIGMLYALVLWLSNSSVMYLSVSFTQMLKSIAPVTIYLIAVAMRQESWSWATLCNMGVILFGTAVAAYGEIAFLWVGVIMHTLSSVAESLRLVVSQMLLQTTGIKVNPVAMLCYVAPSCLLCLLPIFAARELPIMLVKWERNELLGATDHEKLVTVTHLFFNSVNAFVLNCSSLLLLGNTSALVMKVTGVVKDWVLIGLSVMVLGSSLTVTNVLGYTVALAGVVWYQRVGLLRPQQPTVLPTRSMDVQEMRSPTVDHHKPRKHVSESPILNASTLPVRMPV